MATRSGESSSTVVTFRIMGCERPAEQSDLPAGRHGASRWHTSLLSEVRGKGSAEQQVLDKGGRSHPDAIHRGVSLEEAWQLVVGDLTVSDLQFVAGERGLAMFG